MCDSRFDWEGLGWRNKSTIIIIRMCIKPQDQRGAPWNELGKWRGPRANFQGMPVHGDWEDEGEGEWKWVPRDARGTERGRSRFREDVFN